MTAEPTTYERKTTETVEAMQFDGTAESAGRIWDWVMTEAPFIAHIRSDLGDIYIGIESVGRVRVSDYVVFFEDQDVDIWTAEKFEAEFKRPAPRYATGGYINPNINLTDAILGRR